MEKENITELSFEARKAFWNNKAKPCSHYERFSEYARRFLEYSGIREGESVFDMGCGSGTLCLPLADLGHPVFCADFSENMLKSVQDAVDEEGISLITCKNLAWEDDWTKEDLPVCDLAFASRSVFLVDPFIAIPKLASVARRRVCFTVPLYVDMFKHPESSYTMGGENRMQEYFEQCKKVIREMGYEPEVVYLENAEEGRREWAHVSFDLL